MPCIPKEYWEILETEISQEERQAIDSIKSEKKEQGQMVFQLTSIKDLRIN